MPVTRSTTDVANCLSHACTTVRSTFNCHIAHCKKHTTTWHINACTQPHCTPQQRTHDDIAHRSAAHHHTSIPRQCTSAQPHCIPQQGTSAQPHCTQQRRTHAICQTSQTAHRHSRIARHSNAQTQPCIAHQWAHTQQQGTNITARRITALHTNTLTLHIKLHRQYVAPRWQHE